MLRAGKRTRGFDEALQEMRSENIGSPGGSQDHWDAMRDLKSDVDEANKAITKLCRQVAQLWEALTNEEARRADAVNTLRDVLAGLNVGGSTPSDVGGVVPSMLVVLGSPGDGNLSPVPVPDGSQSPTSVFGQVIDLTVDDEDDGPPEEGDMEPWDEAYPAPESQEPDLDM